MVRRNRIDQLDTIEDAGFINFVDLGRDLDGNVERPGEPNGAVEPLLRRDAIRRKRNRPAISPLVLGRLAITGSRPARLRMGDCYQMVG